eukprot:COSAG01_NODE_3134_length_6530_cov_80.581092_2_plen_64_part_00
MCSYKRFCKMMDLGVPLQAVKNKMAVEAPELNPEMLEYAVLHLAIATAAAIPTCLLNAAGLRQ